MSLHQGPEHMTPRVKSYLVTGREHGRLCYMPIMGYNRGMASMTTRELWPTLAIVSITETNDWEDCS
jgi:hypothetical protein